MNSTNSNCCCIRLYSPPILITDSILCPRCGKENKHNAYYDDRYWHEKKWRKAQKMQTEKQNEPFVCAYCQKTLSAKFTQHYTLLQYKPWFVFLLRIVLKDKTIEHKLNDGKMYGKQAGFSGLDFFIFK